MRFLTAVLTVLVAFVFIGVVMAVTPGNKVEYAGGPLGKVVFDGRFHADKGMGCFDCHPGLFQMGMDARITMENHFDGKSYCFACHNAAKAFGSSGNCVRCHVKE